MKFMHPDYKIVTYNEIKDKVKSGDIILFASLDSNNQLFMMSYFTHIGVVYKKDEDSVPVLIESFNPYRMKFYPEENSSGIIDCDLEHRINSYRGFVLYKELEKPISKKANKDFADFIEYAKTHMEYDENVAQNEIGKILFGDPFTKKTNCGQFTTLILLKLNLLDFSHFRNTRKHHLLYTAGLTKVKNNVYKTPIYVYSEYFKPTAVSNLK